MIMGNPSPLNFARVRFFPNAGPLVIGHPTVDFDFLRLDEKGLYILVVMFIVVLFRLNLLQHSSAIQFMLRSPDI